MGHRVSPVDVRVRVVAATLAPALSLARAMALPLDDLEELVTTGYFREARERGWSMRAIARRFGKSLRSVTTLSQRARRTGQAASRSEVIGRRRRTIAWLGSRPGATRAELHVGLGQTIHPKTLDETLADLLDEGVLEEHDERLRVHAAYVDMVQDDLAHRLDSLRHFLDAVTLVVQRRFFAVHEPGVAFARTITFSAPRDEVEALWTEAFARLHAAAVAADERAGSATDATQVTVAICLAETPAR